MTVDCSIGYALGMPTIMVAAFVLVIISNALLGAKAQSEGGGEAWVSVVFLSLLLSGGCFFFWSMALMDFTNKCLGA